jgi:Sulfotransferase domain
MARDWYLIVGLAKTGTTAVAMTLRNTLLIHGFCMEPADVAAIEAESDDRLVIKILFDHWQNRTHELKTFLHGTDAKPAPTVIAIIRDPRDEAISRLHYAAYNYFSTRRTTEAERADWINVFRRKEEALDGVGLVDMERELMGRFGFGFSAGKQIYELYCNFIDDIIEMKAAPFHLLRYEEFVDNAVTDETLRSLLSGSHSVGPLLRRVYRSGSSGDWRHYLTNSDIAFINKTCEPFLRRFDYPFEGNATAERSSPTTGSDYVANLIDEARELFEKTERAE